MSFIKGIMDWVNGNDEDEEEEYPEIANLIEEKKEKKEDFSAFSKDNKKGKIVDIKTAQPQLSVVVVRPQKFDNAVEITDNLKMGKTVALNFEKTDSETTRRLLDFLSGATYALDAELTKVSTHACIITPNSVSVLSELVDELEITGVF